MNDGFNWFVLAIGALGLSIGLFVGASIRIRVEWVALPALAVAVISGWRFFVTPVKGVEDDQE